MKKNIKLISSKAFGEIIVQIYILDLKLTYFWELG